MKEYESFIADFGYYLYEGTIRRPVEIEAYPVEHACSRYIESENGLIVDPQSPIPKSPNGYLYRVDVTSGVDFITLEDARNWANSQPWAPIFWNSEKK